MTQAEFTAFYPQFAGFTPAVVMTTYIGQANARFESFSGQRQQEIASKKVGEVSVTYSSGAASASISAQTDLADLTETSFGLQLLSLLQLYSMSRYVP